MFSGVKQMIPALLSLSAFATAAFQRAPGAISVDDIHGFSLFSTSGNHSCKASAAALLPEPDQLINTLI